MEINNNSALMSLPGALSEEQLIDFKRKGVMGPFDSPLSDDALDDMFVPLVKSVKSLSDHPLYGRYSVRDWHLLQPALVELVKHPEVCVKLQQILGEDLILWRSKVFYKRPGDGPIEWHQEWGAFNGEEIGNDKPSLLPKRNLATGFWNLTIWVAMQDVTLEMGPMQFVKGSYLHRYPIDMIPMTESAFWQDPFLDIEDKQALITRCNDSKLVLDIDSSKFLHEVDTDSASFDELKALITDKFATMKAAITEEFDIDPKDLMTVEMKKGQYLIFPERTMHRSLSNTSGLDRFGINYRVTTSDTLVYPSRLVGDFIDGSNINIKQHQCVLLSGEQLNDDNVYQS